MCCNEGREDVFKADGSILEHFAELQLIFQIFRAAGAPYSEFAKIEKTISSLRQSTIYDTAIRLYNQQASSTRLAGQTFNIFTAFIAAQAPDPVSRNEVYWLSDDQHEESIARVAEGSTTNEGHRKQPQRHAKSEGQEKQAASKPKPKKNSPPQQRRLYCYTHGYLGHSSRDCYSPNSTHKYDAKEFGAPGSSDNNA